MEKRPPNWEPLLHTLIDTGHPDEIAVDKFADAMKSKLAIKRREGVNGWDDPREMTRHELYTRLIEQISKGADMIDLANYAMMIWHRDHWRRDQSPNER